MDIIIKFELKNGWHISWQNPGDAGVPTKFFTSKEITPKAESSPEKFLYDGILTQYGFSDKAYYLLNVEKKDEGIPLKVSWTACQDYCEPMEKTFLIENKTTDNFEICYQEAVKTFPTRLKKPIKARFKENKLILDLKGLNLGEVYFVPHKKGLLSADANQKSTTKDELEIEIEEMLSLPQSGIIVAKDKTYEILIAKQQPNIFWVLFLAFVAGIILNLMPCVFPVLSLKALNIAHNMHTKKRSLFKALAYTSGVVLSFLIIASILFLFKSFGVKLGWGFQLQSPMFVGVMIVFFTGILLFMLDILPFKMPFMTKLSSLSSINSFMTGFLAVLIASPCAGPFMGAVIGYALFETPKIYFPVFFCLSIGYALPFALLEMFPLWAKKIMPRPGKWMECLKYILTIPIMLTIGWLGWIFYHQTQNMKEENIWEPYSVNVLKTAVAKGNAVFVDFTAKWCLTCLLNEKTTLSSQVFLNEVRKNDIKLLKADWTNQNDEIFEALKNYGRSSVPLYVYYPEESENYIILPQILTLEVVLKAIQN